MSELDYSLVTPRLIKQITNSRIIDNLSLHSDHMPIMVTIQCDEWICHDLSLRSGELSKLDTPRPTSRRQLRCEHMDRMRFHDVLPEPNDHLWAGGTVDQIVDEVNRKLHTSSELRGQEESKWILGRAARRIWQCIVARRKYGVG